MLISSLINFLCLFLGLAILLLSGESLVKGSASLAVRLGIPPLIIGLTVIAFGTSAPELFVSINAVLSNSGDLALGNIIGSNIANFSLVLGLPALFTAITLRSKGTKRSITIALFASFTLILLSLDKRLDFIDGFILLFLGLSYLLYLTYLSHKQGSDSLTSEVSDIKEKPAKWHFSILYIIIGVLGLPIGAHLIVTHAQHIALLFKIPDSIIGLTIIALGTSLPELAAAFSAIWRKHSDLAVGSVLGSNIFNIFMVGGASAVTGSIPVPSLFFRLNYPVMLFITLILAVLVFKKKNINAFWGLLFVLIYTIYILFLGYLVF